MSAPSDNTLLYTPGVKVIIAASASGQILDISEDIESGNMTLRQNNPHGLNLTVSNPNGKYAGLFTPDDRIIVQMKRISWLQTFSGYLDKVPYFQAYPSSVNFSATCTLKRLKFHFWDPNLSTTADFIRTAYNNGFNDGATGIQDETDAGMKAALIQTLTHIVGWDVNKIHIGGIPQDWITKLGPLFDQEEASILSNPGVSTTAAIAAVGPGTTVSSINIGPGTRWTAGDWASAVLLQIGAPVSLNNVVNFLHWMAAEEPQQNPNNWWHQGLNNPLNLGPGNSYPTLYAAAVATGSTKYLRGSLYANNILPALQGDVSLSDFAEAVINSPWDFGGYDGDVTKITGTTIVPGAQAPAMAGSVTGVTSNHLTTGTGGVSQTTSGAALVSMVTAAVGGVGDFNSTPNNQAPGADIAVQWALANLVSEEGLDCSAFTQAAWAAAGVPIPRTSETQYNDPNIVLVDVANILPGDILFGNGDGSYPAPGHVALYLGGGMVGQHDPVRTVTLASWIAGEQTEAQVNADFGGPAFYGVGRVTTSSTATGNTKGLTKYSPDGSSIASGAQSGASGLNTDSNEALIYGAGAWNPIAAPSEDGVNAAAFTGLKILMLDTPIMPFITEMVNASLRCYCSAPNGDFIAWFPDYFGQYGYAATWHLSTVELIDFNIDWSDENLVTHQYVAGSVSTANTSIDPENGGNVTWQDELNSFGVATIDMPGLLTALTGVSSTDSGLFSNVTNIYKQFGPRPNFIPMATVGAPSIAEFWFAIQKFQENWANQFSTDVKITFMPELWPGMLLAVDDLQFQCYITEVNHSWNMSDNGGFETTVSVCAPSALADSSLVNGTGGLIGLAVGGPATAT
jgi:cell wall-associated NlpC family hydrolase